MFSDGDNEQKVGTGTIPPFTVIRPRLIKMDIGCINHVEETGLNDRCSLQMLKF